MPAKAGIQSSQTLNQPRQIFGYWIIRLRG
jgi:hypothetical protein